MNQSLDPEEWPSICFEGELLPQSVSGISILINRGFTERTGDWIWRLSNCKEVWKNGEAEWCIASATEIIDHLLEHRGEVASEVRERLGPYRFDGDLTVEEWLIALARVQSIAKSSGYNCQWIAGHPSESAEEVRHRLLAFLDSQSTSDK